MRNHAIITENDESEFEDVTGVKYEFPNRYLRILQPGTEVIYYKGSLKNRQFRERRLTDDPHYFGTATIGTIHAVRPGYSYADIVDFQPFSEPVALKLNGSYREDIPDSRQNNYFYDGVRAITLDVYNRILGIDTVDPDLNDAESSDAALTSEMWEGGQKGRYTTRYERNKKLRAEAIRIHGLSCMGCGVNFGERYGKWGEGFIHVHHIKPIFEKADKTKRELVDPATDLIVVCPNCHSMIHRKKSKVLTLEELKQILRPTLAEG